MVQHWTSAEVKKLFRLVEAQTPNDKIAKILKKDYFTISNKKHTLGLTNRRARLYKEVKPIKNKPNNEHEVIYYEEDMDKLVHTAIEYTTSWALSYMLLMFVVLSLIFNTFRLWSFLILFTAAPAFYVVYVNNRRYKNGN